MVKSKDDGSVAPFLKKCYEMVDDDSTNSIISWSENNDNCFIIWDITQFSVQLLPKYFKHNNSSSFIRQLNIYGFRKVDTDRWEFANDGFVKGQKHLLKNIRRRKNLQSTDNQKSSQQPDSAVEPLEKIHSDGLRKEIENLKTDKSALMQELVKLQKHQEDQENNLLVLGDRVQGMEKNQQQMLSFLVLVMQNPGFLMQLLHPKENNWRMAEPGSIIEQGADEEQFASDGMIVKTVKYLPQAENNPPPMVTENPPKPPLPDAMKDSFLSPDFVKLLMDENLTSFETLAPFIFSELPDDGSWEKLLLGSTFMQNVDNTKQDGVEGTNAENEDQEAGSGTQIEEWDDCGNFEFLMEQLDKSDSLENQSMDYEPHSGKSQNLEIVTKKMTLLASETNQNNGL